MATKRKWIARLRVVSIVLAVVAGLVCVATFGAELSFSPFSPVTLNAPTTADSNGEHTAIVDSESRRMLIMNENYELVGIVNCEALNSPVEAITDVCVTNSTVYVAGVVYQKDSVLIEKERVVAYDMHGYAEQIVYERDANLEKLPSIKTMDNKGDGVYFVQVVASEQWNGNPTVMLKYVDRKDLYDVEDVVIEPQEYYDIGYSAKVSEYWGISMSGVLVYSNQNADEEKDLIAQELASDHMFTSVDVADNGNVYVYDDSGSGSVCFLGNNKKLQTIIYGSGYSSLHANGNVLTACRRGSDAVVMSSLDGLTFIRLEASIPSKRLAAIRCVTLAARVYLLLFLIVAANYKFVSFVRQGKFRGFGPMFASLVVVSVVALSIGYTTYGAYKVQKDTRVTEVNTMADYLLISGNAIGECESVCSDRSLSRAYEEAYDVDVADVAAAADATDAAAATDTADAANTPDADSTTDEASTPDADSTPNTPDVDSAASEATREIADIHTLIGGLAHAATLNGMGIYATVYGVDDNGPFYLYDSSSEHVTGSSVESSSTSELIEKIVSTNEDDLEVHEGSVLRDKSLYRLVRVSNSEDGSTIGVIEIGTRMRSFESSIASDQMQRVIALLVIMLVVYLTYTELRECVHCFVSFQQMKHHHDSIAILTRPFSFFVTLLASIDSVMTTLIARDLIASAGLDGSGLLLALPTVMLGIGLAIGQAIYGLMGSRVVLQKLMVRGAILMICAALITAAVVWSGNFWLYCVAKLAMAIPFGLLYTLSYSLPRRADTDEVRALAASGIKRTDTSAAALGTVLGGYAAQSLGNAWVYLLVAVVGVIVLVMARNLLPSTKHPLEHEAKNVDSRYEAILMLLTSGTTIPIILFVMLPAVLAAGYSSFMFPLFSANLGLDKSAINNLSVLGQVVVFVCISYIERLEERYDKWRVSLIAVALLGVVFLLFSFNTTLVWAVVTIALVGVLCKASDGWKAMWPRSAKDQGLHTGMATGSMFAVRSVLLIVQPLLLGALLSVSSDTAVIILGGICFVCAVAFYFTTRRSALAPKDETGYLPSDPFKPLS